MGFRILGLLTFLFTFEIFGAINANTLLILKNQFGEQSNNNVVSSGLPLAHDFTIFSGATAPVNGGSGTGVGFAGTGSLYVARDTGALYQNTNTKASPTWGQTGTSTLTTALTGFVAGAGTVSATDTVLQAFDKVVGNANVLKNGTFTPTTETISAAGAISTVVMESTLSNGSGSTYAATLAAPSSQDGQLKVLKMGTATHTVTVAMTNIAVSGVYTPSGTTTLTFTAVGDSAIFMAVGSKWVYLGGSAVAS